MENPSTTAIDRGNLGNLGPDELLARAEVAPKPTIIELPQELELSWRSAFKIGVAVWVAPIVMIAGLGVIAGVLMTILAMAGGWTP